MKYRFTAEKCNFQGEEGYMVKQYEDDVVLVDQFISSDGFKEFQDYLVSEGYGVDFIN